MSSKARTAGASAITHAPRLSPVSPSSLLSSFVVGLLLLAIVLLPLITAGCGPPT